MDSTPGNTASLASISAVASTLTEFPPPTPLSPDGRRMATALPSVKRTIPSLPLKSDNFEWRFHPGRSSVVKSTAGGWIEIARAGALSRARSAALTALAASASA
eukprot:5203247-Pleurochrysis_carterae.AAC.1